VMRKEWAILEFIGIYRSSTRHTLKSSCQVCKHLRFDLKSKNVRQHEKEQTTVNLESITDDAGRGSIHPFLSCEVILTMRLMSLLHHVDFTFSEVKLHRIVDNCRKLPSLSCLVHFHIQ
jgi:hypothetical protein